MVLGRKRKRVAISGTVSKSLPLDALSPIAPFHGLEPQLDGRCRNNPPVPLFATFEFSGPDKSVQVVESNPEDSRCLDCCHFCFFLCPSLFLLDTHNASAYACAMQRDMYTAVTVSILIPTSKEWAEGQTFYDEPIRVRAFTDDDLDQKSRSGKETWRQIPEDARLEILNIVAIIRALESNDEAGAEKAILALKSGTGQLVMGVVKASLKEPEYKLDTLVKHLCCRLDDVRLVLWKIQGRLAPGILCPDIRTAFFVHVLMSAVGARASLRLCPKCGKPFMQKRADQEYCSVPCREAHRIERWRARKKSQVSQNRIRKSKPATGRAE